MGRRLLEQDLEEFNQVLPMGYAAKSENSYWSWGKDGGRQYLLLGVVIAIIFLLTGILFNSLKQPLAIISVIPVSYIGVFLTFYVFRLNFDQGGFASFVLLCGITVNASIYILNEYNNLRRRFPRLGALHAYVKAWNAKVVPIFLTVISTILGFIPFHGGYGQGSFLVPFGGRHHWRPVAFHRRHIFLPAVIGAQAPGGGDAPGLTYGIISTGCSLTRSMGTARYAVFVKSMPSRSMQRMRLSYMVRK